MKSARQVLRGDNTRWPRKPRGSDKGEAEEQGRQEQSTRNAFIGRSQSWGI